MSIRLGLSVGVSPRESLIRFRELAAEIESFGYDAIWVLDSPLASKDVYVALTVAALGTSTIKLGTGVTNPVTRHLLATANAAAGIHEASGGRMLLGVGAGDSAVRGIGMRPARVGEMEDAVGSLRQLLRGNEVVLSPNGKPVRLPFDAQPVPVYVAASQPRMLDLAGRLGDGVVLMGPADREAISLQMEKVREGATAAGRDPSEVDVDVWVTISVSEDDGQAIRDVSSWASAQARLMTKWKELPPGFERFRPEMEEAQEVYDYSEHLSLKARHALTVSEAFASALAIAGTPETCAERLSQIVELAPDRITLSLLPGGRRRRLAELAERVLPQVPGVVLG